MKTFEEISSYLEDLTNSWTPQGKIWAEGFICGLANADGISEEVENQLLKWVSER